LHWLVVLPEEGQGSGKPSGPRDMLNTLPSCSREKLLNIPVIALVNNTVLVISGMYTIAERQIGVAGLLLENRVQYIVEQQIGY